MAVCSSIPAWRIPWTEEPVGYTPWVTESDMTKPLSVHMCLAVRAKGSNTCSLFTPRVPTQPLSRVRLFATPQTIARQAPLSMGFPRREYWDVLPFPSNLHLLHLLHWQAGSLPLRQLESHLAHSKSPFIGYYELPFLSPEMNPSTSESELYLMTDHVTVVSVWGRL